MKKLLLLPFMLLGLFKAHAQIWVDSLYGTQTFYDIPYGVVPDFAGNDRELTMDISVPVGDAPPTCGRPLMLLIHGGAFIAGTKAEDNIANMRRDFAERGYVTAAINYRLGMFQTDYNKHCNITLVIPSLEWDCLNQTDTVEWFRAYYRGVQDAHGAIRWLVHHASDYLIDPNNVFVVGESAGGFIALGTGYMDDVAEVPIGTGALADVPPPNSIYDVNCVQHYDLDTNISSMDLARPDLGSIKGSLNLGGTPYNIRGVGSFYGAAWKNYFIYNNDSIIPGLYLYHQPYDPVVPIGRAPLFADYAYAATLWPWNCEWIINRPWLWGSRGIKQLIDARILASLPAPDYLIDTTTVGPPGGPDRHAIDNYTLRTHNMAAFLATHYAPGSTPCVPTSVDEFKNHVPGIVCFPSPANDVITILSQDDELISAVSLYALSGVMCTGITLEFVSSSVKVNIPSRLPDGLYMVRVQFADGREVSRNVMVRR